MKVGDNVIVIRQGMRHYGKTAEIIKILDKQGWPVILRFPDGKEISYHPDELEVS